MSIKKGGVMIAGATQCVPDLFDWKWADHVVNDVSWLRADTFSWQSGSVYEAAYQHLADDIDGKTLQSETVGSTTIQFYLADDGHKICPANEESNVAAIYTATGVAWYYIIDTVNERFKLPRSKHNKYAETLGVVGNGSTIGFVGVNKAFSGNNALFANAKAQGVATSVYQTNTGTNVGLVTNATESGILAQQTQDTDQHKYLYFFMGLFTKTAIENTSGVNSEIINDFSAHRVIAFQAPTSTNGYTWYRKYADGWVEQGQDRVSASGTVTVSFPVAMASTNYTILKTMQTDSSNTNILYNQVSFYNKTTTGATTGTAGVGFSWFVAGMAA